MKRGLAYNHGLGSARAGDGCSRLIRVHWGGEVRNGTVGACVSTLAGHPTLAERRLLLDPHLAKATGRWCLYTQGNEKHDSASRLVILKHEVTKNNLSAFTFPMYFVSHSPKVPHPVPVKLESSSVCVTVSAPETFWKTSYWTGISPQLCSNV